MEDSCYWYPVRNGYLPREREIPKQSKRKIVSIPVHFVGAEEENKKKTIVIDPSPAVKSAVIVKIQKVFRGFLVRKNLRIVRIIAGKVDEIERMVREGEDRIRSEEKERLRVNEMLMSLLLRLDSVRGVRDYRKKVIRRVISLQERVDSIAANGDRDQDQERREETKTGEIGSALDSKAYETIRSTESAEESAENGNITAESKDLGEEAVEFSNPVASSKEDKTIEAVENRDSIEEAVMAKESSESENLEAMENKDPMEETLEFSDFEVVTPEEVRESKDLVENKDPMEATQEISDSTPWTTEEITKDSDATVAKESPEDEDLMAMEETLESEKGEVREILERGSGGMKEVMERMVAENEKLKGLVAELCERSAQQCRLMGGLAERVEQLERVVQKMERKKKRNATSAHCEKSGRKKQQ